MILTCGTCLNFYGLTEKACGGRCDQHVMSLPKRCSRRRGGQTVIYLDNAATTLINRRR